MNNEQLDLLELLNDISAKNFIARTNAEVFVKNKIKQLVRDLTWIELLEKKLPHIDDLVRNPRSFIVPEESLLPVEKTKKISKETLKHLAQNTSLIQDVEEDGSVVPLKLLNIFKESTFDLYENRFVYSLILNIKSFINEQLAKIENEQKSRYMKHLKYNAQTRYAGEYTKIKLEIRNEYKQSEVEALKDEEVNNRIRKLNDIFRDFLTSKFALEMYGSLPVRSPLRKTNAILKDANLKELIELWEFIESYNREEAVKVVMFEKEDKTYDLDEKLKPFMYASFNALNSISKKDDAKKNTKFSSHHLRSIIENYVSEYNVNEKQFKEVLTKEFKIANEKKLKEYDKIKSVFQSVIENHNNNKKIAVGFLK